MPEIDKYPDLQRRRDYELQRLRQRTQGCKDCDESDIRRKWERVAAERANAERGRRFRS